MTQPGNRRLDRVLAPDFLEGLESWSMAELRAARSDAEQEETDLSYLRRLLQGRMDILRALQAAATRGVCVVISSIESQDLAAICDRVIVLREGEIAQELRSDLSPHAITSAAYPAPISAS